ncbi:telomeric repeat-binding factor 2-like [Glandiceps talaboti]
MAAQNTEDVYTWFHRLHLAFAVHEYWEEFRENCTVDEMTDRELYAGVIRAVGKTDDKEVMLIVRFLHLICRLVDGKNPDTQYIGKREGTPLETALGVFGLLSASCNYLDEEDIEYAKMLIRQQSVVVCCQNGDFEKAEDVYYRMWEDIQSSSREEQVVKDKLFELVTIRRGRNVQRYLARNSYQSFHKKMVNILSKIHSNFEKTWLFDVYAKLHPEDGNEGKEQTHIIDESMEMSDGGIEDIDDNDSVESTENRVREISSTPETDEDIVLTYTELKRCKSMLLESVGNGKKNGKEKKRKHQDVAALEDVIDNSQNNNNSVEKRIKLRKQHKSLDDSDDDNTHLSENLIKSPYFDNSDDDGDRGREKNKTSPRKSRQSRQEVSLQRRGRNHRDDDAEDAGSDKSDHASPHYGIRGYRYTSAGLRGNRNDLQETGEAVDWSESDCDVPTPSSHIPAWRDICHPTRHTLYTSPKRMSQRRKWTDTEVEYLKEGVKLFGVGQWAQIRSSFKFEGRTNVHLKDKWRTLTQHGAV